MSLLSARGYWKNHYKKPLLLYSLVYCVIVNDVQGQPIPQTPLGNQNFTNIFTGPSWGNFNYYRLFEDVDLGNTTWADHYSFEGGLNGGGYRIYHVSQRLFYSITSSTFWNLHFEEVNITSPFNGSPAVLFSDKVLGQTSFMNITINGELTGTRRLTENSARSEDRRKLRIKIRFCEANSELFNEQKRIFRPICCDRSRADYSRSAS